MTTPTQELREQVAEIIDRDAWEAMEGRWEDDSRWLSEEHRTGCLRERQGYALAKADAILALPPLSPGAGVVEPQPIETANRDEDTYILASTNGKVWFQCSWCEDDQEWVTFNRYLESDARVMSDKRWVPTMWLPIPALQAKDPAHD